MEILSALIQGNINNFMQLSGRESIIVVKAYLHKLFC